MNTDPVSNLAGARPAHSPAMQVARASFTHDQVQARFPRLIRALAEAALLTRGEAISAVSHFKRAGYQPYSTSEAACHIGGSIGCAQALRRRRENRPVPWTRSAGSDHV